MQGALYLDILTKTSLKIFSVNRAFGDDKVNLML